MAKYSYEFKKMIVDAYLNGEGGYKHLSSVYGPTRRDIQKWVNRFRAAGPDALRPHKKGRKKIYPTPSTISSGGIGSDVTFPESCINSCHSCSTAAASST